MLRITWLYQYFFLFLWNFDVCWGHIRNRCRNDELPIVLLQRDHVTGNFTVVERFSEDDTIPPVGSYGNDRHLMATDYLPNYWESTTASLRSTVNSLRVKDFPGLSLDFHLEESPTRTLHVSDEHDVHTTLQISDEYGVNTTNGDLFYARECTCFSYDLYPGSTIYCPMVVNTCREVSLVVLCCNLMPDEDVSVVP